MMSRKMRVLSFALAIIMIVTSTPIAPVSAQASSLASGMTNPFDKNISFMLNGQLVKSDSYRIPSIVTLADGTIVATADIRWNTTYDGGGLDTLVARSTDGGKTWTYNVANYLSDNDNEYNYNSTTFIDSSLLVAADGMTVYMLTDLYAYGVALNGLWKTDTDPFFSYPESDTGFDANGNLKLSSDGRSSFGYYLSNGKIYANGATEPVEGYSVDPYFNITYIEDGKTVTSNLFFENSPFKVARTQFLYLTKSTDGGATWSAPTLLNLRVPAGTTAKDTDEDALLVSPGDAITTSSGVMVYPVYSYAHYPTYNSASASYQHMGLIYSTDGVNWERTANFTGVNFSSEGAVVELENGNLRVFFRNDSGYLCYVDYDLRTNSWINYVKTEIPTNSNTQMSAITYSKTSNGKQVILVSCPTGPNGKGSSSGDGSQRSNGKIHVFTVSADGTMNLENTVNVFDKLATDALSGSNYTEADGFFAYSSLEEMSDGSLALLYENNQIGWGYGKDKYYTITNKGYSSSDLGIKLDRPETVVVDANGKAVNNLALDVYEKATLKANTYYFTGNVEHQWQIEHEEGKWADIYGETGETLKLSFGLVGSLMGIDGRVAIRCKSTKGVNTIYSQTINVNITASQPEEPEEEPEEEPDVTVSENITTSSGETVTVTVTGSLPEDASVQLGETDSAGVDVKPSETVVAALDISIKNADGTEWQPESGETVTVTLEASKIGLQNGEEFVVYHVHNDEVALLGIYKVVDNTISFEVDGFSKFVFAKTVQTLFADDLLVNREKTATLRYDYFAAIADPSNEEQKMALEGRDYEAGIEFVITDVYVTSTAPYNIYYKVELKDKDVYNAFVDAYPWIYHGNQGEDPSMSTLIIHEEEQTEETDIFAEYIDKYAAFNAWNDWIGEGSYDYFWLKADPTSETEETFQWSVYDEDFEIDLIVKVRDYYIDAEDKVWIHVEPVNGLELPESLKNCPWVHLNSATDYNWEYDTLFFFEPEDPSGEDIAVVDKYGMTLWEMYLYSNEKREITVQTNLTGDISYRWEVCYDTDNLLWSPIEGQTSPTLNVSFAMLSGVLQDGEWAALRCVASNATETVTSNVIIARVQFVESDNRNSMQYFIILSSLPELYSAASSSGSQSEDPGVPAAEGDEGEPTVPSDNRVVVTLTAQKENGDEIFSEGYQLEYNGTANSVAKIPYLPGYDLYDPDGNKIELNTDENVYVYQVYMPNVTENKEIILTYKPGMTTYKVVYYQQNVFDDGYTQVGEPVVLNGLTDDMVDISNEAFNKSFDGFYQLLFEVVPIASDGSTTIEIHYDRLYYKTLFGLDGGYGVQPVYARYGTPVTVSNPTKAGYVFAGWEPNKGWTENFVSGEVTEWDLEGEMIEQFINIEIPAYHTSYTAVWRANDAATVTVVIWGENADSNGYSYIAEESFTISANPGATITYRPSQNMCGFEAHTHGAGCDTNCGKTEHTHNMADKCYVCELEEHTEHTDACWNCGGIQNHTISCYQTSDGTLRASPETNGTKLVTLRSMNQANCGILYQIGRYGSYQYYFKLGNEFYEVYGNYSGYGYTIDEDTTITLRNNNCHPNLHTAHGNSCSLTCHQHTDPCFVVKCQKVEHTHETGCYTCDKKEHTHDAGCRHTTGYDNNELWDLNEEKTGSVTVAADGSTVYNVYYDRTMFTFKFQANSRQVYEFSAKWGDYIVDKWTFTGSNGVSYSPANQDSWKATGGTYTQRIFLLITMPAENATFTRQSNNDYSNEFFYYVESLVQEPGGNRRLFEGKYYDLKFELNNDFGRLYYDEDFFELKGFTRYKSARANGNEYPLSNSGTNRIDELYFYYTRDKSQLVFNNYGTNERDEDVLYQAPLSQYGSYTLPDSKAPDVYEEGSVTFKGWYQSPQVPGNFNFEAETPFDFATETMPEGNLILYAWWQPVSHNVTFYHSKEAMEAGEVYTAEGITYDYDVPHGSKIQNPYTPPADPTNGKYEFDGWFYINDEGMETMWSFEDSTVTTDVKIYAKWISNTLMPYTVRFVYVDKNGNEIEIADPITGSALAGNTKTFNAKAGSELYNGYQSRYFPTIQSHSLTIDIEDESKNVYTFYYVYREYVPYDVYYLTKENPGTSLGTTTYEGETYYLIAETKKVSNNDKVIVTENAELISGYVFDEYQKRLTVDPNDSTKNVLYFFYTKDNVNGQYVVHYMTQNVAGTGFDEHSSFTGIMPDNTNYTVPNPPKEIEHFTWDEGYNDGTNIEKLSGTVKVGEVLELWVYYTRDEYSYKVQYLDRATGLAVHDEKTEKAKWESQVTENAVNVDGYELVSEKSYTLDISDDPSKNVIVFYYVKDVTINYKVVGPVANCGTVTPATETVAAVTGEAKGSVPEASNAVYKFVGWYMDAECSTPVPAVWVDANGKITPQKPGDMWKNATYYAKFEYNLTSLTIVKVGAEEHKDIDPNQTFIFNISGNGVNMDVTVHRDKNGNWSTTIDGLTVGAQYIITEKTDWSWRYNCTGWTHIIGETRGSGDGREAGITLGLNGTLIFTNTRGNEQWLDGDSWCNNIFSGTKN